MSYTIENNEKNNCDNVAFISKESFKGHGILNINGGCKISKDNEVDVTNNLLKLLEQTLNISKKNNKKLIIINIYLQKYKLNHISKKFISNIITILTTIYPDDILYQCNLINPSFISEQIIHLIKKFIPNKQKVKIIKNSLPQII
jgi:hypothetical protein